MDAILATLTILQSNGDIAALVGTNIYGGQLPEHYNPETSSTAEPAGNGPAIVLSVKGGSTHSEFALQDVDVQLVVWVGINGNYLARQVYQLSLNLLHGITDYDTGAGGMVKSCLATVPGTDTTDPDTGWVMNVSSYHLMMMDTAPSTIQVVTGFDGNYAPYQVGAITGVDGGGQ